MAPLKNVAHSEIDITMNYTNYMMNLTIKVVKAGRLRWLGHQYGPNQIPAIN
jgi:hypothetical protein